MRHSSRQIKRMAKRVLLPGLIALSLVYVMYHTVTGERGFMVWLSLRHQVASLEQENTTLRKQVAHLEDKVERLDVENPDLDYIEEVSRRTLGWAKPGENVVYVSSLQVDK